MAHTDHHAPDFAPRPTRTRGARHSLGVSLANRGAGAHVYRDEIDSLGGKTCVRRRVRRTGRHAFRAEVATYIY